MAPNFPPPSIETKSQYGDGVPSHIMASGRPATNILAMLPMLAVPSNLSETTDYRLYQRTVWAMNIVWADIVIKTNQRDRQNSRAAKEPALVFWLSVGSPISPHVRP